MMKNVFWATLFLGFAFSNSANAMGSKVGHQGSFRFRMDSASNEKGTQMSVHDRATIRFRSRMTYSPRGNLSFNLTPQAFRTFGDMRVQDRHSGDASSHAPSSLRHSDITFYEANMKYHFADRFSLQVGRQELSYGDESLLGTVGWSNHGQSFDAIRLGYRHLFGTTHLFTAKVANHGNNDLRDDEDLLGLYNMLDLGEFLNPLDIYYLKYTNGSGGALETITTMGLRLAGTSHGVNYHLEYNKQSQDFEARGSENGDTREDSSSHMGFGLGYSMGSTTARLAYSAASKDYHQMFPTGHKFLGHADVLGRRNVKATSVHLKHSFGSRFSLMFDYHMFKRNDTGAPAYKLNGSGGHGTAGTSDDIGNEMDIAAKYMLERGLDFHLGVASFTPGDYIKANRDRDKDEKTRYIYAQFVGMF